MVNPNNIHTVVPMKIDVKQQRIGIVMNVEGEIRFYFSSGGVGDRISSKVDAANTMALEFFMSKLKNTLDLTRVLELAGAEVVNQVPKDGEYIDLSNLDRLSLIGLLS